MNDVKKASCLILKDKNILLVKNNAEKWSLPGGNMQDDEPEEELASESSEKLIGAKPKMAGKFDKFRTYAFQSHCASECRTDPPVGGEVLPENGIKCFFRTNSASPRLTLQTRKS